MNKQSILTTLSAFLISTGAFAQEKGTIFEVGESILNFAGFSYNDLESDLTSKQFQLKKCQDKQEFSETWIARLRTEECANNEFKSETIPLNILDLLSSGCEGQVELQRDEYQPALDPVVTVTQMKIITSRNGLFLLKPYRKSKNMNFQNKSEELNFPLENYLRGQNPDRLPKIVLEEVYNNVQEKKTQGNSPVEYFYMASKWVNALKVKMFLKKTNTIAEGQSDVTSMKLVVLCPMPVVAEKKEGP